jgi:hypothetical protein
MSNYQMFRTLRSNACSPVGRPQTGMRKPKVPLSFERWFLIGVRRQEKRGADFTFLCPRLVRITWPEKVPILRTTADFEREYYNEYLSKFYI